jgi:thymidylate synthase (FAD)
MMDAGATAEQARAVLPGCVATRILAYASPDEWRHIFGQRCDRHADPQMAALMEPLRAEMAARGLI